MKSVSPRLGVAGYVKCQSVILTATNLFLSLSLTHSAGSHLTLCKGHLNTRTVCCRQQGARRKASRKLDPVGRCVWQLRVASLAWHFFREAPKMSCTKKLFRYGSVGVWDRFQPGGCPTKELCHVCVCRCERICIAAMSALIFTFRVCCRTIFHAEYKFRSQKRLA